MLDVNLDEEFDNINSLFTGGTLVVPVWPAAVMIPGTHSTWVWTNLTCSPVIPGGNVMWRLSAQLTWFSPYSQLVSRISSLWCYQKKLWPKLTQTLSISFRLQWTTLTTMMINIWWVLIPMTHFPWTICQVLVLVHIKVSVAEDRDLDQIFLRWQDQRLPLLGKPSINK